MSFYLRVKSHMCVASGLHKGHTGLGAQRAHSKLPSRRPGDGARDPAQHQEGKVKEAAAGNMGTIRCIVGGAAVSRTHGRAAALEWGAESASHGR